MNRVHQHRWQQRYHTSQQTCKRSIMISIFVVMLIAICSILSITNLSDKKALAEDNTIATEIDVTLSSSGTTTGTSVSLDRSVYHSGDEIIVKWKGQAVGDDFIIPTAINVNGNTLVSMSELNKVDLVQTSNVEYKRRVGDDGTLTTYDALHSYLTSEHQVSLGTATLATNVEVQYTRVSPVYRMYNMITSEHLFSTNKSEYDGWVEKCALDQDFWIGEGIDWLAPTTTSNTKIVHRLYNEALGAMGRSSHYYTADEAEMTSLINTAGWVDDGEANWFMSGGTTPIYTCYNEALGSAHHYTSSKTEWSGLAAHGWALEEDKNGTNPARSPEGVFQCTMATNWAFSPNYYTVEHRLENVDNTYSVQEKQVLAGTDKNRTRAAALQFPGYEAQEITQKIISGNSTVVQVNYSRKTYSVTFDGNGVTLEGQSSKLVKHGDKVPAITTPNASNGREFKGWYFDRACTKAFSFDYSTMPAGNLTLYAGWTKGNDGGDSDDINKVKVTFYLHGLGDSITKEIAKGSLVDKIADPTYDGFTFGGWYTDLTYSQEFDFTKQINTTTTIYAKWTQNSGDAKEIYYVTLDYQGKGSSNTVLSVFEGRQVPEIANPTHSGYRFDGWYTSNDFVATQKYDFTTPVTKSFTLYAKWVVSSTDPVVENINIIFNYMEKGTNASTTIKKGSKVAEPTTPSASGYKFGGWYTDTSFADDKKFDFNTVLYDHLTLYAYWIADNRGVTGSDGQTTIKHPTSGDMMSVLLTYDHDGNSSTPEVALPSAVVEINALGSLRVTAPDVVVGKDVTVTIKDSFGVPVSNLNVALNEASGKSRGYGATNTQGVVKFAGDNKKDTGEDGKAQPVNPGTGEVVDTTVTYDHDNDTSTPEVPLSGAKVEISKDGNISVTLPEEAKGKDVTVNAKDESGSPLVGKDVTVTDTDGQQKTEREPGKTDENGNAKFEGTNKGVSGADGTSSIVDPSDGTVKKITVTYDKDGDHGKTTDEVALSGATIEIDGKGKVKVVVPKEAEGKDVTVNVKDNSGNPVSGRDTSVRDFSGSNRGDVKTDSQGNAKFPASSGTTGEDGKVNPLDPSKSEVIVATVTYDDDSDTSTPEVPLSGAKVEVAEDGKMTITLPSIADDKDVSVNLKDKLGSPISGKSVSLNKSDGTNRGTGTTDNSGDVKFGGTNKGTTGTDGTSSVQDPSSGKKLTVKVTYDSDGNASTAEVALSGAKIEIDSKGKVKVELPSDASGRDVTVNVKEGTTAVVGRSVSVVDALGYARADKKTDANGDAKFPASSGKTDEKGEARPLDPDKKEIVVTTVTYDHDNNSLTPQVVLPGAGVEIASGGEVTVTLPDAAIGKDVTVNLKDNNGNPFQGRNVTAIDSDGASRGTVATDLSGNAKFAGKNKNKTGEDGSTEIVDPSTGLNLKVTVKVDSDGDASNGHEPLSDASVEIDENGRIYVRMPEVATGMDAWVNVSDMAGKGVAGKQVELSEFSGNKRADGTTDENGDVAFPANKGKTDESGNTKPVKPSDGTNPSDKKDSIVDTTITYDHDSDSSTPEVPLPGAEVEIDKDGNLHVKLPEAADGKDITVNAKDKDGNPLADRTVDVTDSNGSKRPQGKTDAQGDAKFQGDNKATTGADGKATMTDPTTGEDVTTTVTYDKNGDGTITSDEVCPGAEVEIRGDGKVYVKLPSDADDKDVSINLKDKSGAPIAGKSVSLNKSDGTNRGNGTTDSSGDVKFQISNKGTTGADGTTEILDPRLGKKLIIKVTYDSDDNTSTAEVALPDANIEIGSKGIVKVELPSAASGRDVTVNVKDAEGNPVVGKEVQVFENNGEERGASQTDNDGNAKFKSSNQGTTGTDGKVDVIDPSTKTKYGVLVTYPLNGTETPISGAEVVIDTAGEFNIQLPANPDTKASEITVTITDEQSKGVANKNVNVKDSDGAARNKGVTNAQGVAVFKTVISTEGYFLATANAADPVDEVKKSAAQIRSDVVAIKAGDTAVMAEYNRYMLNDNVHLYTPWSGNNKEGANAWVEFKVASVSTTGVCFNATHALPVAMAWSRNLPTTGLNLLFTNDIKSINLQRNDFKAETTQIANTVPYTYTEEKLVTACPSSGPGGGYSTCMWCRNDITSRRYFGYKYLYDNGYGMAQSGYGHVLTTTQTGYKTEYTNQTTYGHGYTFAYGSTFHLPSATELQSRGSRACLTRGLATPLNASDSYVWSADLAYKGVVGEAKNSGTNPVGVSGNGVTSSTSDSSLLRPVCPSFYF